MKSLVVIIGLFYGFSAFAVTKSMEISVGLFPAGSFIAETNKIKGKLIQKKDGSFQTENIRALVKYFHTGIEVRDEHFRKRLGYEKDAKASLDLVSLQAKDGKGIAVFKVDGVEQQTNLVYKTLENQMAEAEFELDLEKFKIKDINYLGVGVENVVKIKIQMPYSVE